jgi:hypothetical protein
VKSTTSIYERISSEKFRSIILKGRQAEFGEACMLLKRLSDDLWHSLGPIPICTQQELVIAVRDALLSPHLKDDAAATWLCEQLEVKCRGRYHDPQQYPVGLTDLSRRTEHAASTVWDLEIAGDHFDCWYVSLIETPSPFAQTGHLAIQVVGHGMSDAVFTSVGCRMAHMTGLLRAMMDATFDSVCEYDAELAAEDSMWQAQRDADDETVRRCLELWLAPPSKTNQLRRRLCVAFEIVAQAASSGHVAVKTALCCAAIEALVLKRGSDVGVTEGFAVNTTALLQPNGADRPAAMKRVKRLYAVRSDLIHGNSASGDTKHADEAYRLACGTIRAVMQWMRAHDAIDAPAGDDDAFFEAIGTAARTGAAMSGVSPELADTLP